MATTHLRFPPTLLKKTVPPMTMSTNTSQPLSTPGLVNLEEKKDGLFDEKKINSATAPPEYSPDEKIWRPVFEKGDPNNDGYIPSEGMRAYTKGWMGLSPGEICLLRDNFHLSTWILLGAVLQGGLLYSTQNVYSLAPACLILAWRIADVFLQMAGIRRNPNMANVILGKFSVHEPDEEGNLVGEPGQKGRAVIMLSTRCNHPLGMFAPGFKELGDLMGGLLKNLEENPEKYGYRGCTSWLSAGGDRTASQEVMLYYYFRSIDDILKFAHSPAHRVAWDWWTTNFHKLDHISITHEMYEIAPESSEVIYENYHRSGLAMNNVKLPDGTFVAPLVDASEGQYKTSAGRLNRVDHGRGNDRYPQANYQKARMVCPVLARRR